MCLVSVIGDHFNQQWTQPNYYTTWTYPDAASKADLEALRLEVQEVKELLARALEFDKKTGQPDCHMDEKIARG